MINNIYLYNIVCVPASKAASAFSYLVVEPCIDPDLSYTIIIFLAPVEPATYQGLNLGSYS